LATSCLPLGLRIAGEPMWDVPTAEGRRQCRS
jgi:hypothetical protein